MKRLVLLILAIIVFSPGMSGAAERKGVQEVAATAPENATAPKLDLNRASREDLEGVPGIGPRMAQAIVELRTKKGPFKKVEDLLAVAGIKEKKLAAITRYLEVLPVQTSTLTAPATQPR